MSPRSASGTLSPSRQGFVAISNNYQSMNQSDSGIPLTTVRTNASTGSRRQGDSASLHPTMAAHDEKGGFLHRGGKRQLKKTQSRGVQRDEHRSVTSMGRFYEKMKNFSSVTRWLIWVVPIALLLAVPIVISKVTDGGKNANIGGMPLFNFWLWIEIVWLSLWVAKLLAKIIPQIFLFAVGVVSTGTKKYVLILRALEIPISLFLWAIACLVSFNIVRISGGDHWTSIMVNILLGCVISTAIYLVEKLFVQLVSIGYHQRSFDNRIKESKHQIWLLGLLFDASRAMFPLYCKEFEEEDYIINDGFESILMSLDSRSGGSASPLPQMHILGGLGRLGDKVTSVFGNIASEITGKQVFNPSSAHSIIIEALERKRSAEALAKRLWMSFVVEGQDALSREDIIEVLGHNRTEEAEEVFESLDSDGNGDVSLDEMVLKVLEISRERKALANSMHDVGEAIGVLDSVLLAFVLIIVVIVFISLLNTNFVTTLATASTTLLSLSFVFALTTQEFLGACIFLFVKHPYDVGDRVDINGPEKEPLVVQQISLLYTVFKRVDTDKTVQVPNNVLSSLWIENVTRSKALKEQLELFISFDTSFEDIELLRLEMEKFVRAPENSRDFHPDFILECTSVNSMEKLSLKVEIRHKSNWNVESIRAMRISKFMCALVLALRKVPIYGPGGGGLALGDPGNPSYSVSVTDQVAQAARDKAAKAKDASRMVPLNPVDPALTKTAVSTSVSLGTEEAEKVATTALTTRNLMTDDSRDFDDDSSRRNDSVALSDGYGGLVHRQSTRGRRKAGAGTSPSGYSEVPIVTVNMSESSRDYDEEAQVGVSTQAAPAYTNTPYSSAPTAAYTAATANNNYPPPPRSPQPPSSQHGGASPPNL